MAYLAHSQTRRFGRMVERSQETIHRALNRCHNPYLAYSTGKDSTVMADLVWSIAPDVPAVYFDAHCAFPESLALIERMGQIRRVIRWECEPFMETLARVGGPMADTCEAETMRSTVYRPIKSLLEEYHFDSVFVGLRSDESSGRMLLAKNRGDLFYNGRDGIIECLPVLYWRYDDIWAYIVSRGIDYNAAYDTMEAMPLRDRRISYWAGETGHTKGRWSWLRQRYPDLWNSYIKLFPEVARFA